MDLETHLKGVPDELGNIILAIARTSVDIRAGFLTKRGLAGTENIYGERQLAMDRWADEIIVERLGSEIQDLGTLASEERSKIIEFNEGDNLYHVTLDPLDGSSLMDVNFTVGTIVGIHRGGRGVLSPGREQVGAMYVLYGPLNILVYTSGEGVHEFVLNEDGKYLLREENISIPPGKIYAPGALRKDYLPVHRKFIEHLEAEGYKLRYSGSFVADVHQILHKGGLFTYPAFEGADNGKLRLLFEANPVGFIISQAGGAVSTGKTNILDIQPRSIADRTPIYIGSSKDIYTIEGLNRN